MILTICSRGAVRSVTAAVILRDYFGWKDVIPVGLDTTSPELLKELVERSEQVFVVGEDALMERVRQSYGWANLYHVPVGYDRWGLPMHPQLIDDILLDLELRSCERQAMYYVDRRAYMSAVCARWRSFLLQEQDTSVKHV